LVKKDILNKGLCTADMWFMVD